MRKREIHSVAHWAMMFIILMFPLLMVGVSAFSKSEIVDSGYVEKTDVFDNSSTLIEGKDYYFQQDLSNITGMQCIIKYNSISINWYDYQNTLPTHNYEGFYVYGNNNPNFLLYYYNDSNQWVSYYSNIFLSDIESFTFNYNSTTSSGNTFNGYYVYSYSYKQEIFDYRYEVNSWINQFIDLPINSWYKSLMNVIGVGFTSSTVMNVIYVMPVYILWVFIFDVIVDCFLVIIKLPHKLLNRLSGGENE